MFEYAHEYDDGKSQTIKPDRNNVDSDACVLYVRSQ